MKIGYVSPPQGQLSLTVVRDARPTVILTLDLGIPNFTVFNLKYPMVPGETRPMTELTMEALNALNDEVITFMLSMQYDQEVCVQICAAILACFKGLGPKDDTEYGLPEVGKDESIQTYEAEFTMPQVFVDETYNKVITAADKTAYSEVVCPMCNDNVAFRSLSKLGEDCYKCDVCSGTFFICPECGSYHVNYDEEEKDRNALVLRLECADCEHAWLSEMRRNKQASDETIECSSCHSHQIQRTGEDTFYCINCNRSHNICPECGQQNPMAYGSVIPKGSQPKNKLVEHLKCEWCGHGWLTERYKQAANSIKRLPVCKQIQLTHIPPTKNNMQDAARAVRMFRNVSPNHQPWPLYVMVYDQMGRTRGVLPMNNNFKNDVLKNLRKK